MAEMSIFQPVKGAMALFIGGMATWIMYPVIMPFLNMLTGNNYIVGLLMMYVLFFTITYVYMSQEMVRG